MEYLLSLNAEPPPKDRNDFNLQLQCFSSGGPGKWEKQPQVCVAPLVHPKENAEGVKIGLELVSINCAILVKEEQR